MRKIALLSFVSGVFFLAACGDPVPVNELVAAKRALTKAQNVKAEKYAPEKYNEAAVLLMDSHTSIKNEKYDDAAKKGLLSEAAAVEAYNIAAPLLAKDAIDVSEQSIKAADDVFASELAKDEYESAVNKQKAAQADFESKQYESAYKNAIESDGLAKNARNSAISGKGMIEDSIKEVRAILAEAKKYGAESNASEKYNAALESLANAEKAYSETSLKEAYAYADEAKINADEAYQQSVKETALDKIDQAKSSVSAAESSSGAAHAPADLKAAKELVETAEMQYNEGNYLDSIDSSNESLRLSGLVSEAGSSSDKFVSGQNKPVSSGGDEQLQNDSSNTSEESGYDIYKVKYRKNPPKDCLWIIAKKFYKNPHKWKKIFEANKDLIKNPDWIFPGWELRIPKESR